ncbi:hypothetical protein PCL_03300 [Purpureocillium lilacinum]|uniref:Uncharacterized protein n=1 Tax=Purpureocillium lilacinum TaxID=33203 RepID=A0A2U3ENM2_PURLI|nr:hypothetical protein PCL_03300 [Purpureocillium lilacinum]
MYSYLTLAISRLYLPRRPGASSASSRGANVVSRLVGQAIAASQIESPGLQSSPGGRAQVIDAHTKVNKETGHLGYNYLNGPPNQTRLLACPATAASLATTSLSTAVCLGRLFSPEEITPGLRSSLVRRGQSVPQVLCRVDAPWQRAPGLTGGGLPVTPSNISHSAPHSRRALRTSTSPADLKTLKRTAQNDAAIGRLEAHDSREGETKSNKHTTERPDAKHTKAISGLAGTG